VAVDTTQRQIVSSGNGFFAALDQSGGSTPKALADYGVPESRYSSDTEMFDLVHAMRTRIVSSPAFNGSRIIGAILFEQTMDRQIGGLPTGQYLWEQKRVVPFLKVDKGLTDEQSGVQLMKPIPGLDELLQRANGYGIFGTKMRSVIKDADKGGVSAIVDQQFEVGAAIRAAGLVPILEPEVSIKSPHKDEAEALLVDAIQSHVDALPDDAAIMLKLTIPSQPGLFSALAADARVLRVLALSGGYSRDEACRRLAADSSMIASFSRALLQGLSDGQSDEEFNAQLDSAISQIYDASVNKTAAA
jgi:fructose-bisphosphate aldolase, class I